MTKYEKDKIVIGHVTGVENYGIFVNLDEYYSGLIHISEISSGFVKNIHDMVKIGETIRVKVLEVDDKSCQLKLSIKNIDYKIEKPKKRQIEETVHAFSTLQENLPHWISEKIHEISKIEVK